MFFFLQFIDVQPNDGFGTLLPLETFSLDVTFSPMKPKVSSFFEREIDK